LRIRTSEYVTEFARFHAARGRAEGEAEGEARGEARALIAVLAARGIELTIEQKRCIEDSTSLSTLDKWLERAATASTADEVFA
jgi:hypothetical protein